MITRVVKCAQKSQNSTNNTKYKQQSNEGRKKDKEREETKSYSSHYFKSRENQLQFMEKTFSNTKFTFPQRLDEHLKTNVHTSRW